MQQSPAIVRDFRPADAPALWAVFHSAIHGTARADYSPEQLAAWAPADHDPGKWAARMAGLRPFVAEAGGEIVGYADLQADGYIDHFFVARGWARRGVGSALMRHILGRARERGVVRLYSDVSLTARPFFETFGFVVEAAQQVTVRGVTLDNFRMARQRDDAGGAGGMP